MRTKKTAPDIHRARLSVVIRLGFEPKTHSLEGCCSIQLSYRTAVCRFARFAMGVKSGCKDNFISSKAQNYFSKGLAFIIFAVFPVALFLTAFFRKVFFLTVFFWEIFYREVFVGVVAGDHGAGEFDGDYQYEAEEGEDDGAADVHVDHA